MHSRVILAPLTAMMSSGSVCRTGFGESAKEKHRINNQVLKLMERESLLTAHELGIGQLEELPVQQMLGITTDDTRVQLLLIGKATQQPLTEPD